MDPCVLVTVVGVPLLLIWGMVKAFGSGATCDVCSIPLKRARHKWRHENGTFSTMCSNCNRTMERRQSSRAMRSKLDD